MLVKTGEMIRAEGGSEEFESLTLLGEGRTGQVHLVRDARAENEQWALQLRVAVVTRQMPENYALKIAREEPASSLPARNARISEEQMVLERLVHPGIVRSGTGGWHEGRAFFSMELLEGLDLGRYLMQRRRTFRELMVLILQLSDAVARCHERGVLHRDIRPSNITVEPDRGPVLFDFESCASQRSEECSRVGVGAAEYAAPEYLAFVLDPSASYVNQPRGDMYAMGVILFSGLTGRLPVERGARELSAYLQALRDVTHVSPLLLNPEVPPACAALAMRLLSKNGPPDARELPGLVQDAMEQDPGGLDRLAPRYEVEAETLLSSVLIPARRPVSSGRGRARWEAVRRLSRRYAPRVLAVAFVAAVTWLSWSVMYQAGGRASLAAQLDRNTRALAEDNAVLARAVARIQAQLAAAQLRPPALVRTLAAGLKMPEKPDPTWLKPSADGKCHNPVTGERMQGAIAIRGACWGSGLKINPKDSCPEALFDPPPEVESEPRLQHLRNHCFNPFYALEPQAANPGPSQADLPERR